MRKVVIGIVLCMPFFVEAQTKFGIRAGLNFASIYQIDLAKKPIVRLNIGTMIEIPFDENWFLYTGPYYSGKGVIFGKSIMTNRIDSFTIRLNYIELPINVGYKFSEENEKRVSIFGGPYISYGFNGQISVRNSTRPATIHLHRKETDQYKRLEFGLSLSSLYEIKDRYGVRIDISSSLLNIARIRKERNMVFGFSVFWYMKKKAETE